MVRCFLLAHAVDPLAPKIPTLKRGRRVMLWAQSTLWSLRKISEYTLQYVAYLGPYGTDMQMSGLETWGAGIEIKNNFQFSLCLRALSGKFLIARQEQAGTLLWTSPLPPDPQIVRAFFYLAWGARKALDAPKKVHAQRVMGKTREVWEEPGGRRI